MPLHADDEQYLGPVRHGAWVCLCDTQDLASAGDQVEAIASELNLENEFSSTRGDPPRSIAYLRRVDAEDNQILDEGLLKAVAIVHVAAETADPVDRFRSELGQVAGDGIARVLAGVVRPPSYTGAAMHNFTYAHRVLQQPATLMPNAFVMPMSKTPEWWAKDWMERHTYFLPRYDDGRMLSEGHVLASAAGVPHILRRTYRHPDEVAPVGDYDFVNHFECADENIPIFNLVCESLRDTTKNPEWRFVREGPTWRGRRVRKWAELFD